MNAILGMLHFVRPAERPIGVPRKVALRQARNKAFKDKSLLRARRYKTPEGCLAKYRLRRQRWEDAPHRLAYAVMIPLIRRYRQGRGLPVHAFQRVPEDGFEFWIEWLEWIYSEAVPVAAAFRESSGIKEYQIKEPIQQLIRALSDCRDGIRSRYTERLFVKKLPGRKPDIEAIAHYKEGIGTAYRVLTSVGMCSRSGAIKAIHMEMRRMGFIETPDAAIPEYARKVSDKKYTDGCRMFIGDLFNYDDNPLLAMFPRGDIYRYIDDLESYPDLWRRLVLHYLGFFQNNPKRRAMLRVWAMNKSVTVSLLLGGLPRLRELERFHGYVRPDARFSSFGAGARA
jgi:hypothetical protein